MTKSVGGRRYAYLILTHQPLKESLNEKWSSVLAASVMALSIGTASADDGKTIYFYNWTEYVPPGLLEQFTKRLGLR